MHTEKQKNFLVHVLYYVVLFVLLYYFFRYVIYAIMPFLIGFFIAFLLRPLIRRCARGNHEKAWSCFIIIVFYTLLLTLFTVVSVKGFFYIKEWLIQLPSLYQQYVEPYLSLSLDGVESVWEQVDSTTAQLMQSILQSIQNSLSSLISNFSSSILLMITNFASTLPSILITFSFSIIASFFINSDYPNIMAFFTRQMSERTKVIFFATKSYLSETMGQLMIAYGKLMLLTFIELVIGLSILGVEHVGSIALFITLFDIVPILGTGGIMLPWALLCYVNQQTKLAIGLLIVYLIIMMVRNILEPRIIGKQIGLHPLLMLLCMYTGAKLFGFLGIFLLPFLILIVQNLNKSGLLHIYR